MTKKEKMEEDKKNMAMTKMKKKKGQDKIVWDQRIIRERIMRTL